MTSGGAKHREENKMQEREEKGSDGECTILDTVLGDGFPDKVTLEHRPGASKEARQGTWRKRIPGGGISTCNSSES